MPLVSSILLVATLLAAVAADTPNPPSPPSLPVPPSQTDADGRGLPLGEFTFTNVLVLDRPAPIELVTGTDVVDKPLAFTLRPADSIRLSDTLRLDAGFLRAGPEAEPSLRAPLLSSVRARGGESLERGTSIDYFELTLAQQAFVAGPLTLSAIAGVQGAAVDTPTGTDPTPPMTATPVAGGELTVALSRGLQLSGRGVVGPRLGGADGYDVGLSLGTRWRLSSRATLEVEYQFVRSAIEAESFKGELRRESVLVEFKLAF